MFFVLSKVLGFFALPSNFLLTLAFLGLLLARTRFARGGRRLVAISLILLAVLGLSPLADALILPLEERFPRWDATRGPPDGIIVLGGAVAPDITAARGQANLNEAAERMTAGVELARRYPAARVVFTGGEAGLVRTGATESDAALLFFESQGLSPDRVLYEGRSRNTAENASMTKALVDPKPGERWLLVTSAHHMPRSMGIFRQAGFLVEAYPVDWRTAGPQDLFVPFDTVAKGLVRADNAMREWVGLVAYRLTGRSQAFFPGP